MDSWHLLSCSMQKFIQAFDQQKRDYNSGMDALYCTTNIVQTFHVKKV